MMIGRAKVILTVLLFLSVVNAERGRVTVSGNTVFSDQGTLLRGTTFYMYGYLQERIDFSRSDTAWKLLKEYRFNSIRLSCAHRPERDGAFTLDEFEVILDELINRAADAGIYVILDFHDTPGSYTMQDARDFWNRFAPRYGNRTHVIFEITNEPVAWSPNDYKPKNLRDFEELYGICRTYAPETHCILLSFPNVNEKSGISAIDVADSLRGIDWTNASVGFHTYDISHSDPIVELKEAYPVFCTEFSMSDGPTKPIDGYRHHSVVMEKLGISWLWWDSMDKLEETHKLDSAWAAHVVAGTLWEADSEATPVGLSEIGWRGGVPLHTSYSLAAYTLRGRRILSRAGRNAAGRGIYIVAPNPSGKKQVFFRSGGKQ